MDSSELKTLHDRWVKNRACIQFSVCIKMDGNSIKAEMTGAPPQYKNALLSLMEMVMGHGISYIKAAYHDAVRKKGLSADEENIHNDLNLRITTLMNMLINSEDMEKFCQTVDETAYIYASKYELNHLVFTADGWKKTGETEKPVVTMNQMMA